MLWRAAYLASLGACLWVMRAGARHLLWCILGSQRSNRAKHAALASCGLWAVVWLAGKPSAKECVPALKMRDPH